MIDARDSSAEAAARGEKIARRMSRAGIVSRREAERMVLEGRVTVDGRPCRTPAARVAPESRVEVDGRALPPPEPSRLWRLHKPPGVLVARVDPAGRSTVFDLLPARFKALNPVGRLDLNSEGLLLLTNDGALKRGLELPASRIVRSYRVRVRGAADRRSLERLEAGLELDGERFRPMRVRVERMGASGGWLRLELTEGRWREVRRALAAVGLPVARLVRVAYGPYRLAGLNPGELVEASPESVRRLARRLARGGWRGGGGGGHP